MSSESISLQHQLTAAKCRKIAELCVGYREQGMGVLDVLKRVAIETHNSSDDVKRAIAFCLMAGDRPF